MDGWRLGLAICRDTGIPGHASATAALGIDVYVAGLTDLPHEDVIQEQRAQRVAAEHGVWVAFASFAGPTGSGFPQTAGRSGIWSPDGRSVVRAGPHAGRAGSRDPQPRARTGVVIRSSMRQVLIPAATTGLLERC